ncbi:MAG: hypothetical protein MUE33_03450 [Cytophagaceae bacterium]|nr:hypothetical protein [Cytophagaceae bacterium]
MLDYTLLTIPSWVTIVFLISIPLPFLLIGLLVHSTSRLMVYKRTPIVVSSFFIVYLLYVMFLGYFGVFKSMSFPPKIILFTTLPYALILFMWVQRTTVYADFIRTVSLDQLIRLHVFRIIGVFFILLSYYDTLPKTFAWIAGLGDILTAISSIFVVYAIQHRFIYAKQIVYVWSVFGTVDIIFTSIAANVLTKIAIDTGALGVDVLAEFPFYIIPAFAPPTILFLHWTIFKKMRLES